MNLFSKNLAYLMKVFGVRQAQLALHVDKAQTTIANWVNNQSEPNIENLVKIVQYFGVSLDDLIFTDIEKGKVITPEHLSDFHRNGKLNSKGNGKALGVKSLPDKEISAADNVNDWSILNALKIIDGKMDQVILSLEKTEKKGS